MPKVAIINDQHKGVRNDDPALLRQQVKFDQVFFDYIRDNGIKQVFHAGDLLDRRKYINFNTLYHTRKDFLEPLDRLGCEVHVIAGNHDQYYKNSDEVLGIDEVLRGYQNIRLYREPVEIDVGNRSILMIPWICDTNQERILQAMKQSKSRYALAHLELYGFEMDKGNVCEHGMKANLFSRFDWVGTGHFHHRSSKDNIHYLGAAYQFTWHDYNDPRGFTILDTDTGVHHHVDNPFEIFRVYVYDDKNILNIEEELKKDFSVFTDCHVKIEIKSKTNEYLFDMIVNKILKANPIKLSFMETEFVIDNGINDIDTAIVENTPTLVNMYVDGLNLGEKSDNIKKIMADLYREATAIEDIGD